MENSWFHVQKIKQHEYFQNGRKMVLGMKYLDLRSMVMILIALLLYETIQSKIIRWQLIL